MLPISLDFYRFGGTYNAAEYCKAAWPVLVITKLRSCEVGNWYCGNARGPWPWEVVTY